MNFKCVRKALQKYEKNDTLTNVYTKMLHKTNSGGKGCTPTHEKTVEPLSVQAKEGMSMS